MRAVRLSFDNNVREVESFFRFLKLALRSDAELHLPLRRSYKKHAIADDAQRMLKASALLVLYNLIESTVQGSVGAIHDAIARDCLRYEQVRDEVKLLWIDFRVKNLNAGTPRVDTIRTVVQSMVEDVVNRESISMARDFVNLSGNVDARKIRELSNDFGFSSDVRSFANRGESLKLVKDKRNDLAHGIVSFGVCGGEFTISQLATIKHEVVIYLRNIIGNIARYVNAKRYAVVR